MAFPPHSAACPAHKVVMHALLLLPDVQDLDQQPEEAGDIPESLQGERSWMLPFPLCALGLCQLVHIAGPHMPPWRLNLNSRWLACSATCRNMARFTYLLWASPSALPSRWQRF